MARFDDADAMTALRDEFEAKGVVRVRGAFAVDAAAAIADTVWGSIERRSRIRRLDASTWPTAAPSGLSFKNLKGRQVFEPVVRSEAVCRVLDEILGEGNWHSPKVGAQILLTYPSPGPWVMPSGWHIDGGFDMPTWPPPAIRMFSCFDTVVPEGGGTLLLEGSHHLVERYMAANATPIPGNSVTWGRFLRHHPELADLHRQHTPEVPSRDLVDAAIRVGDIDVRPVEVQGDPGDMYLAHFHVFHSGSPNVSNRPRQMLSTTARAASNEGRPRSSSRPAAIAG